MSFKPAFKVFGEEPFYTNGQAFATREEAEKSAKNRYHAWMQAEKWDVVESDEPVTFRWDDETGDEMLVGAS
jgi:hypothetical protein